MSILIPAIPIETVQFKPVSNTFDLPSTMGGQTQRVMRPTRYAMTVTLKAMRYEQAAGLQARIDAGLGQLIAVPVPQPDLEIGTPGNPTAVSGAGTTLNVTGLTSGYKVRAGQWISLVQSGRRYLHKIATDVTASTTTALSLTTPLRTVVTSGSVIEVAVPRIEGFIALDTSHNHSWTGATTITFTVTEAQ